MAKSKSTKKPKSTKAENAAIAARMAAKANAKGTRKTGLPGLSKALSGMVAPLTPAERAPKPSAFLDDPRLPAVGETIERVYKDQTYRVERTATDFLYGGRSYRSLSAIASEILGGVSVNGFLWFGLTPRAGKPAKAKPASSTPKDPNANDLATPAGQRRAQEAALAPKRRNAATHTRKVDKTTADAPAADDVAHDAPSED